MCRLLITERSSRVFRGYQLFCMLVFIDLNEPGMPKKAINCIFSSLFSEMPNLPFLHELPLLPLWRSDGSLEGHLCTFLFCTRTVHRSHSTPAVSPISYTCVFVKVLVMFDFSYRNSKHGEFVSVELEKMSVD